MARHFTRTSGESITVAVGAVGALTDCTFAAIVRKQVDSGSFYYPILGASSDRFILYLYTDNKVGLYNDATGADKFSSFTITAAEGWVFVAVTKVAGTTTPRFHKYVYGTDTWTHSDSPDGSEGDFVAPLTDIRIGTHPTGGSNYLDGDLASAGIYANAFSDQQVQALAFSLAGWFQAQPKALWLFDQAVTSQLVNDLSGGGANETSKTGTSVSAVSVPVFNYGDGIWTPTIVTPSVGGTTFTLTVSTTAGDTATVVKQARAIRSATAAAAAVLARQAQKVASAAAVSAATIVKAPRAIRSATSAASAVVVKQAQRTLATTATASAVVTALKVLLRTLSATSAASATKTAQVAKTLTASAADIGVAVKQAQKTLSATAAASAVASALKVLLRSVSATAGATATLARKSLNTLTGTAAASATVVKAASRTLATTAADVATAVKRPAKTLAASAADTATATGLKVLLRTLSATSATTATLARAVTATRATTVAALASVPKNVRRTLSAIANTVGAVFPFLVGTPIPDPSGVATLTITAPEATLELDAPVATLAFDAPDVTLTFTGSG